MQPKIPFGCKWKSVLPISQLAPSVHLNIYSVIPVYTETFNYKLNDKPEKMWYSNELERPELLNRIGEDNILAFNFIDNAEIFSQIARSKFQRIIDFVKERYQADIVFEDESDVFLTISMRTNMKNGGRGMLNEIEKQIVNPLSQLIFEEGDALAGRRIIISTKAIGKDRQKIVDLDVE